MLELEMNIKSEGRHNILLINESFLHATCNNYLHHKALLSTIRGILCRDLSAQILKHRPTRTGANDLQDCFVQLRELTFQG